MITSFKDEYRWLSNFAPVEVLFESRSYPSVEHAYQAAKSTDSKWRRFCREEPNAGKVKKAARALELREDWNAVKVSVMQDLLEQKFRQEPYRSQLLETGLLYIIEGNTWRDYFWGVCLETGRGRNILGHLIMNIRGELRKVSV